MEQVDNLCRDALNFPENFAHQNALEYVLGSYLKQLNDQECRLFSTEEESALNFWDFDHGGTAFWPVPVNRMGDLKLHLSKAYHSKRPDPWCRYLFVHAPHSRDCLSTSREMLMFSFTYFQVMPEFLEFLFPFGKQTYAQDLYYSGFRQRTRLTGVDVGLRVPELGWSGLDLQVCYSLKSIERSISQKDWPWSIRHCAVHHSFDVENIRSTWIIIKGNQLIEERIQSATSARGPSRFSSFQTIGEAFAAALATHLILCDWSAENWRWYIKFLEERFQALTRGAISTYADAPLSPVAGRDDFQIPARTQARGTSQTKGSVTSSILSASPAQTQTTKGSAVVGEKQQPPPLQVHTDPDTGLRQPLPPGFTMEVQQIPKPRPARFENYGQQQFSFSDLQKIQDVEEKAIETALVLKLNTGVLTQLQEYYRSVVKSHELPNGFGQYGDRDLLRFEQRIDGIKNDVQLQILRVEALLGLLRDRKILLRALLDFHNMQANELLASQSRESAKNLEHLTDDMNISAKNMERMTHDMKEIARKTKAETVSMKIITLVTLFFLPGTFISVGSFFIFLTLMSTDIVHWPDNGHGGYEKDFKPDALKTYLAISAPFMVATFGVWYMFHFFEKRKERLEKEQNEASLA